MRKQPLLALVSTTLTLSTTGLFGQHQFAAAEAAPHLASTIGAAGHLHLTAGSSTAPTSFSGHVLAAISKHAASLSGASDAAVVLATLTLPAGGRAVIWRRLSTHARPRTAPKGKSNAAPARPAARAGTRRTARPIARHRVAPAHRAPYSSPRGVWLALRECESGNNYGADTGNGYYGAYQFSLETWQGIGYNGLPSNASARVQDQAAQRLYSMRGWEPWPVCSVVLGLR